MKCEILEHKYYGSIRSFKNGTVEFHGILGNLIKANQSIALEIGAGTENKTSSYLAVIVARLDGLDIDERARLNPALDKVMVYDGGVFPVKDESYDIIVADYVMEHVENPLLMISEIQRVLKPGGHFVFRTPNNYHYVSIVSRFTPHWFHLLVANRARGKTEGDIDPYATYYRFNSRRKIRAILSQSVMHEIELRMVEKQPSYMMFNPWFFSIGVLYERLVNSAILFAGLRSNIFGVLAKPTNFQG